MHSGSSPAVAPVAESDVAGLSSPPADELSPVVAFLKQPTLVDYPGHLAVVCFLSGCNFRCGYCHNAALLATRRAGLPWDRLERALARFRQNWVDAVVLTGGEPTLTPELPELIRRLKQLGFAVKLDTNGSCPDALAAVLPAVDYVALDIKCSAARYAGLTGFADTALISRSLDLLRARAGACEIRTTLLEDIHDDAELHRIGAWVRGLGRYVLQPFVPRADLPDPLRRDQPRTPPARLLAAQALLRAYAGDVVCRD